MKKQANKMKACKVLTFNKHKKYYSLSNRNVIFIYSTGMSDIL